MQDRFQELYDNSTSQSGFNDAEMIDVPIEAQRLEVPAGLENFNARVEQLKIDISQLRTNVETLNTSYRSMLVAMDSAKMQEEVIDPLETKIESSLKAISNDLKNMHEENQVAREHGKWRSNVHSLLTKQFMDVLLQFRRIQSDYHDKVQERVRQRLMIVNPDATPQEIQQAVDTGNLNVFGQQLMDTTAAKDALTYVEGRHREILRIEERVNEIHRLFSDMAAMVNAQGEFIDDIEANVARAGEYVQEANKDLAGALKRKKRNRRCAFICCIITIVLIVIAIITLLLVGNNIGWFKKAAI